MALKTVTMTHPKLPGQEAEVPESAVHHHERAGWKRKSARPTKAEPTAQPVTESKEK